VSAHNAINASGMLQPSAAGAGFRRHGAGTIAPTAAQSSRSNARDTSMRDTAMSAFEYAEKCGCGRIVVTPIQAKAHNAHCGQMPEDSQLMTGGNGFD